MANRSKAPIATPSSAPGVGIRLTITWEITYSGTSVEQAALILQRDAAKALPQVRGRRPVQVTAEPYQTRPEVRR